MSKMLSDSIRKILSEQENLAENINQLTQKQLDIIYTEKWFKMYVPHELGGLALTLPEAVKLQESLSYLDGSLGWTVTLCSGAVYFIGFIEKDIQNKWFIDPRTCWGGSGMVSGTAIRQDGRFVVNGIWKYATGAPHNTVFTANCNLLDASGNPILMHDGLPEVRSFFFKENEVEILSDWDTMGLRSTASHSFRVHNLKVSTDRMFLLDPKARTLEDRVFRYPFMVFAQFTLGINYLGMICSFLDELEQILQAKSAIIPKDLSIAQEFMAKSRDEFYKILMETDEKLERNLDLSDVEQESLKKSIGDLVKTGLIHVSRCFPLSGMMGAQTHTRLNRIWRNIFTSSQHSIFRNN